MSSLPELVTHNVMLVLYYVEFLISCGLSLSVEYRGVCPILIIHPIGSYICNRNPTCALLGDGSGAHVEHILLGAPIRTHAGGR